MLLTEKDKKMIAENYSCNHTQCEDFFIVAFHGKVYKCKLSDKEFYVDGVGKRKQREILDAMINREIIPNRPFKNSSIERGKKYWFYKFVTEAGQYTQILHEKKWYEDSLDIANYLCGNFFKTHEEAEMNNDIAIKMFDKAVKKEYRSRLNNRAS